MIKKNKLFDAIREKMKAGKVDSPVQKEIWKEFGVEKVVFVADSSGFSRITEKHGILHFLQLIIMMRDMARPILEKYNGEDIRFEADNVFALFDSVDDAVKASMNCHKALSEYNKTADASERFYLCMGLGRGRVLMAGGEGVYGKEMNLASKLGEDIAESNEILLTESAYDGLNDKTVLDFARKNQTISGVSMDYYLARV